MRDKVVSKHLFGFKQKKPKKLLHVPNSLKSTGDLLGDF